jgi:mycothiol synthase
MDELPQGYEMRAATQEDLPEVVRLFDAFDASFGLAPATDIQLLRGLFEVPTFDPTRDSFLITSPRGELAGYGDVDEQPQEESVATFGRVHPGHHGKGIGRFLLQAMEARALEMSPQRPLTVRTSCLADDARATALVHSQGYRQVRIFWHMERSLEDLAPSTPPVGVTIRSFRDGDAPIFHSIEERAFHGQWGMSPLPFEEWAERELEGKRFQPELWLLAQAEGENAGILAGRGWETEAWVDMLGVLEQFRGRGIGGALLRRAFELFGAAGYGRVALNVDSDNPTGATSFYEAHGMHVRRRWDVFHRQIAAG